MGIAGPHQLNSYQYFDLLKQINNKQTNANNGRVLRNRLKGRENIKSDFTLKLWLFSSGKANQNSKNAKFEVEKFITQFIWKS